MRFPFFHKQTVEKEPSSVPHLVDLRLNVGSLYAVV